MKHNNMLAMILAGGRGSRLHELTNKVAKPAVSYGGKYRIVDFPLSNCANSGIDVVGVLTQYESILLNSYVAAGRRWGLDAKESGVYVLPPREKADTNLDIYRGTADAISQNIDFIDTYDPEYVLVLSGDHIYKMNYAKMLEEHKAHNADATIAVIQVPMKEASRFGIMNTDANNRIVEFEEKPENPKSTKASMGIYIFDWKRLRNMLVSAEKSSVDMSDFGKNVIPAYLETGESVFAYEFEGYWKDVGTIESLWEANMEYISPENALDSRNRQWKIYSRNMIAPPNFFGEHAEIEDSLVVDGCVVDGTVKHSVLSTSAQIREGAVVEDSVIMSGAVIGKGAKIKRAIIGEGAHISDGVEIDGTEEVQVVGYNEVVGVPKDED